MRSSPGRLLVAALAAAAALAAVPAPAAADDTSVRRAVCANDAEFRSLGARTNRAHRRWVRRGYRRPGHLLRLLADARTLLAETRTGVEAEQPSSEDGARGKTLYLASFTRFDSALRTERLAVRRTTRNRRWAAGTYRRVRIHVARSLELERRARAIFRALGVGDEEAGCLT